MTRMLSVVECESEPLVPVILIVALVKNGIPLPEVTVNVVLDVTGFVANEPLMPAGNPEAESVTGPEKPLLGEIETVNVLVAGGITVRDDGDTEIEKSGGGPVGTDWTTRLACTVCVVDPLVPVIVNGYVPGVIADVLTVSVDDPEPVTDAGANAPFARPLSLRLTVPEKPPVAPTETV